MEKPETEARNLSQILSTWSPCDLNRIADALSNKCQSIPSSFSGYDQYRAHFDVLLQAELAAELAQGVEKFQRSPPVRTPRVRARREEAGTVLVRVKVGKVVPIKSPCRFAIDLEPTDKKGPVGCGDGDVVAVWRASGDVNTVHEIPKSAVFATALRPNGKHGVRIALDNCPDGDALTGQDLEEGEELEAKDVVRHWFLVRLGSVVTLRREHEAVNVIKSSPLLPALLKPGAQHKHMSNAPSVQSGTEDGAQGDSVMDMVLDNMGLNPAQMAAIKKGNTSSEGFTIIQGPPGTGKTRTLIALLNYIHCCQYQAYYETLVFSIKRKCKKHSAPQTETIEDGEDLPNTNPTAPPPSSSSGGSLLEGLLASMTKTYESLNDDDAVMRGRRARRPRLLVCAPSNSAVDEVLTRIMKYRFTDATGQRYSPEIVRVGGGDKVAESVKEMTAEQQAEKFLTDLKVDAPKEIARNQMFKFLSDFQYSVNSALDDLRRVPKRESNCDIIVKLHEKLERDERNIRRLGIAGNSNLSRDEKVRSLARTYVEDAQIVFSTLSGAASRIMMPRGIRDEKEAALFDTVIIDEAAQSTEPSCLVPLMLGAKRCLLVGDPQQLPATVLSAGNAGAAYGQSLLDRISRAGEKMLLLNMQYRMHPAISSFPRRYFYEGNLLDDDSVKDNNRMKRCHFDEFKPRLGPYVFLNVTFGEEKKSDGGSVANEDEAQLALNIYQKLKADYADDTIFSPEGKKKGSSLGFGVVTPYRSQLQMLKRIFATGSVVDEIEIDTVDAYQGREKDVMVFSCVRSSVMRGIGFVRDVRRMNVGLTRARSSLIVLGNAQALADGSKDWAALVDDARERGVLLDLGGRKRNIFVKAEHLEDGKRDPRMRKRETEAVAVGGHGENISRLRHSFLANLQQGNDCSVDVKVAQYAAMVKNSGYAVNDDTMQSIRHEVEEKGTCDLETLIAIAVTHTPEGNPARATNQTRGGYDQRRDGRTVAAVGHHRGDGGPMTAPPTHRSDMAPPMMNMVPPTYSGAPPSGYAAPPMGMVAYNQAQPQTLTANNTMEQQQAAVYLQTQPQYNGAPVAPAAAPYGAVMVHPSQMDMHAMGMPVGPPMPPQYAAMPMYAPRHPGAAPGFFPMMPVPYDVAGGGGGGGGGWNEGGGQWGDARDPRSNQRGRGGHSGYSVAHSRGGRGRNR